MRGKDIFRGKARRELVEAGLSWAFAFVFLICVIFVILAWQAVWVILGLVALFLYALPIVRFRDPFKAAPWEIVLLMTLPALIQVLSGSRPFGQLGGIWTDITAVADSFGLSALGFLIVSELEMYTSLRINRPFAAVFVLLFTMAVAGWALVVEFLAANLYDQYPIEMVGSNDRIMGFLIYTLVIGVVMGVVYSLYVRMMSDKRRMLFGFTKPDSKEDSG